MSDGPQLTDFMGIWSIERRIDDRHGGTWMQFSGQADFNHSGEGLAYVEHGRLTMPGQPEMLAERRFFWRAEPHGIAVIFDDGRPFHVIETGLHPAARHDCAPDVYQVHYDFAAWPEWRAVWDVTGPRKAYRMVSAYRRTG